MKAIVPDFCTTVLGLFGRVLVLGGGACWLVFGAVLVAGEGTEKLHKKAPLG